VHPSVGLGAGLGRIEPEAEVDGSGLGRRCAESGQGCSQNDGTYP
jgi:hypothetical protein